jgi:hypothetical protein
MYLNIHTEQSEKLPATNTATRVLSVKFNRLHDIVPPCVHTTGYGTSNLPHLLLSSTAEEIRTLRYCLVCTMQAGTKEINDK